PAGARGMRLHIMVVEQQLRYTGENGVRLHPMVVRAAAGDRGFGIPVEADGTIRYSFSLNAIRDDVARTLADDIDRRMLRAPPGATAQVFAANGKAYTAIDT